MYKKELFLNTKIPSREAIRPWLILGPYYVNFSDKIKTLTYFEDPQSKAGKDLLNTVLEEAKKVLISKPYEGQIVGFLGIQSQWSLVRKQEKYLSWGQYNFSNHLIAIFLSTIIFSEYQGDLQFRLLTNDARVLIAINNDIIFDSDTQIPKKKDKFYEYSFEVKLRPNEENLFTISLFRIGRASSVGFLLECNNDLETHIPFFPFISLRERTNLEDEVRSVRMERDIFYPEHDINILINRSFTLNTRDIQLRLQLLSLDGKKIIDKIPLETENGKITICSCRYLHDGEYQLICLWENKNGQPITQVNFNVAKITPTPALIGYEHFDERKQRVLEHFSNSNNFDKFLYGELWSPVSGYILGEYEKIWSEIAKYALGKFEELDYSLISGVCKYISERKDCSEFLLQAILRLSYMDKEKLILKPEIRSLIKDTILKFRYWVDEPGDSLMHMSSENHRLLLHSAEFLAGQLFPNEIFNNSSQTGLFHALKGRMYLIEWLRQRGKFGFDEWNSNCYYTVNIAALTNVYDFAPPEDYKIRQMVRQILDYMCFILAEDSFHGIFGSTCGRTYASYIKYPDFQYTASISWLLYGEGSLWGGSGMGAVSLATSKYKPPRIFSKIATNYSTVIECYQRQGRIENENEHSANFVIYRTPHYMLSSVQDYCKGNYSPQTHVAQVTLPNKIVIFWSSPGTSEEGAGLRPDYWSGHLSPPRVIQYKNVLALIWRNNKSWITHCSFEPIKFDEVIFEKNWVFARVKNSYIGIFSLNGMSVGDYGTYAGRELVCYTSDNIWLVECGSEAEYSTFDKFVEALKSAKIVEKEGNLIYKSPSIGEFFVGWDIEPTINGVPIKLRDYPLINSPWAYSDYGSGKIILLYNYKEISEIIELWFD